MTAEYAWTWLLFRDILVGLEGGILGVRCRVNTTLKVCVHHTLLSNGSNILSYSRCLLGAVSK